MFQRTRRRHAAQRQIHARRPKRLIVEPLTPRLVLSTTNPVADAWLPPLAPDLLPAAEIFDSRTLQSLRAGVRTSAQAVGEFQGSSIPRDPMAIAAQMLRPAFGPSEWMHGGNGFTISGLGKADAGLDARPLDYHGTAPLRGLGVQLAGRGFELGIERSPRVSLFAPTMVIEVFAPPASWMPEPVALPSVALTMHDTPGGKDPASPLTVRAGAPGPDVRAHSFDAESPMGSPNDRLTSTSNSNGGNIARLSVISPSTGAASNVSPSIGSTEVPTRPDNSAATPVAVVDRNDVEGGQIEIEPARKTAPRAPVKEAPADRAPRSKRATPRDKALVRERIWAELDAALETVSQRIALALEAARAKSGQPSGTRASQPDASERAAIVESTEGGLVEWTPDARQPRAEVPSIATRLVPAIDWAEVHMDAGLAFFQAFGLATGADGSDAESTAAPADACPVEERSGSEGAQAEPAHDPAVVGAELLMIVGIPSAINQRAAAEPPYRRRFASERHKR